MAAGIQSVEWEMADDQKKPECSSEFVVKVANCFWKREMLNAGE
jgi:hypothetical protein